MGEHDRSFIKRVIQTARENQYIRKGEQLKICVLGHDSALVRYCILCQGQPGLMNFVMNHVSGAGSITRLVDQQSSMLPLHNGYPLMSQMYPLWALFPLAILMFQVTSNMQHTHTSCHVYLFFKLQNSWVLINCGVYKVNFLYFCLPFPPVRF